MPNFDLPAGAIPFTRPAPVAMVYRYWPDEASGEKYELLPHVRALEITETGDATQWTARFRYAFDDEVLTTFFPSAPRRVEDVFGLDRGTWWQVKPGDRLVVRVWNPNRPDGPGALAFDGYPSFPQADLSGETEMVTFEAVFHPALLWDRPIEFGRYRDVSSYEQPSTAEDRNWHDVYGAESCRFNPEGIGNCTLKDHDEDFVANEDHPLFLDHRAPKDWREKWTLQGAVRHLCYVYNPKGETKPIARNPVAAQLKKDLVARVGKDDPDALFDPDDDATYKEEPIEIGDTDCTGLTFPEALDAVLRPHGFGSCFRLGEDAAGDPEWTLEVYRLDSQKPLMNVYLRPAREALDPAKSNVSDLSLNRDGDVANEWSALCERVRYEAEFVLVPKDVVTAEDAALSTPEALAKFNVGAPDFDGRFREWVFDEDGQGHVEYEPDANTWSEEYGAETLNGVKIPATLDNLFGVNDLKEIARRPRPGSATLDRKDPLTNEYVRAKLFIGHGKQDYGTQYGPSIEYDEPSRKWQEVTSGGWEVLENRLGIRITAPNLDDWHLGEPPANADKPPYPGGVVRALTCTIRPDPEHAPYFILKLLTVIEGDRTISQEEKTEAKRRDLSPISRVIRRLDDVRDRFRATARWRSGEDKPDRGAVSEQAGKLHAHLVTRRAKHEVPALTGSITIPRITYGYLVGDRIGKVVGRDLSLAQSVAKDPDAPVVYPAVVSITRTFDGKIATTLTLGDRRADARPVAKRYRHSGSEGI